MESMWFYVLCFYIFIYGRYSVSSCSDFGATSNFIGETHYIGRNLISKTKEKKFRAFVDFRHQKQKSKSTYSLRYQYSPMSNSSSKVILRFGNIVKDMSC